MPKNADSLDQARPVIELEVVRSDEPHSPGRPLVLTPRRFIKICRAIEGGGSATDACRKQLVSYRSFRRHVASNPKYQRRLKQAEEVREHYLLEYHMANVARHAPENLSASLWWLEHRHPNGFALRQVVRDTSDIEAQPLLNKISMEQLIENAKLAQEVVSNPPPGLMVGTPAFPVSEAADS